ncbi:MAG: serine/threonine-protein phosphatase 6 regulatory ankyrin repeat subunit B-like [Rickettsiaceae bacterium]|jgi:ankyrin repeat protein|nr:serine/threonine-protein phosphatase 6 regulatory ankyrin repeat subunit B-like [Rickettsiaceae bacterium]
MKLKLTNNDIADGKIAIEFPAGLEELDLSGCDSLKSLTNLPISLRVLKLSGCTSLKMNLGLKKRLKILKKSGCKIIKPQDKETPDPEEEKVEITQYQEVTESINNAVRNGDIATIQSLMESHPLDGHFYDLLANEKTLIAAMEANKPEMLEWLIKQGVSERCFGKISNPKEKSGVNRAKVKLLFAAKKSGMLDIFQQHGFETDDIIYKQELLKDIAAGNNEMVDLMLEAIPGQFNLNFKDEKGRTALHLAAQKGNAAILDFLLQTDKEHIDSTDDLGFTALSLATANRHQKIIGALLEAGANPGIKNTQGRAVLSYASASGNVEAVKAFLKSEIINSIDLNEPDNFGGTALHRAIIEGHENIADLLIKAGANVDIENENGQTPLQLAATWGRTEVVRALLKFEAGINHKNKDGCTALHLAVEARQIEIVDLLLKEKADVGIKNERGHTALHYAVMNGDDEVIQKLLKAGANINEQDKNGHTSLHLATKCSDQETLQLLLSNNADVNIKDEMGRTALHLVAMSNNIDIGQELLKSAINVNEQDKDGCTAMHLTLKNKSGKIIGLLFDKTDFNVQDNDGKTILHYAVTSKAGLLVEMILNSGRIDVTIHDKDGYGALELAARDFGGNKNVVSFERKEGIKEQIPSSSVAANTATAVKNERKTRRGGH